MAEHEFEDDDMFDSQSRPPDIRANWVVRDPPGAQQLRSQRVVEVTPIERIDALRLVRVRLRLRRRWPRRFAG
ncbi:MAG: hypothetical protein ACR2FE_00865 [Aeromicrobium sp.]